MVALSTITTLFCVLLRATWKREKKALAAGYGLIYHLSIYTLTSQPLAPPPSLQSTPLTPSDIIITSSPPPPLFPPTPTYQPPKPSPSAPPKTLPPIPPPPHTHYKDVQGKEINPFGRRRKKLLQTSTKPLFLEGYEKSG